MDHRGQIQTGGTESGEPWVDGWCRLSEDRVVFFVNDIEVLALTRDTAAIKEEAETVFGVGGSDEPFFFHPANADAFRIDLSGEAATAAARVRLAASQTPTRPAVAGTAAKSKVAAGLLGILLGGIGAHKFYLGDIGLGILYLLFVWTGIPSIVGLIEGIIYLTMTDEAFAAKYG
ncbi:MAG: TM2 domain-containing protein [Acidimicrobiia bacterium]|jgi:TM2 domain-containing membrane protein YozV